jgi:hypothetical protein
VRDLGEFSHDSTTFGLRELLVGGFAHERVAKECDVLGSISLLFFWVMCHVLLLFSGTERRQKQAGRSARRWEG